MATDSEPAEDGDDAITEGALGAGVLALTLQQFAPVEYAVLPAEPALLHRMHDRPHAQAAVTAVCKAGARPT